MSQMETHGLLTGSVNGAFEEFGSLSGTERAAAPRRSSGQGSLTVAVQPGGVERDSGEWRVKLSRVGACRSLQRPVVKEYSQGPFKT